MLVFVESMQTFKQTNSSWQHLQQKGYRKRDGDHLWTTEQVKEMEEELFRLEDDPHSREAKYEREYYLSYHFFKGKYVLTSISPR